MAQWFRALIALTEELRSFGFYMVDLSPVLEDLMPSI